MDYTDDIATCRFCGCTDDEPCTDGGCTWATDAAENGDLCSSCFDFATRFVAAYIEAVNYEAESDMINGSPLEGAHHRAMGTVAELWRIPLLPPPSSLLPGGQ